MNCLEKVFVSLSGRNYLKFIPDKTCISILYRIHTHKKLNVDNPLTFSEKLQWLKLYDHNPRYTQLVDKYEGKEIVKSLIGEEHIIPTLGVWDKFEDIDFDSLPNQFVLKCTHDCGGLVVCKDKEKLDIEAARRKIVPCLKRNYYWAAREWPYKNVKPRIIAEEYKTDSHVVGNPALDGSADGLLDYKFYCFDGKPKFLYVAFANMKNGVKKDLLSFFDLNWEPTPFYRLDHQPLPFKIAKPEKLEEMIEIARKLSAGIPFVRADMYYLDNQVYFSELTFTPGSGFGPFNPDEWERKMGDWITLPSQK